MFNTYLGTYLYTHSAADMHRFNRRGRADGKDSG